MKRYPSKEEFDNLSKEEKDRLCNEAYRLLVMAGKIVKVNSMETIPKPEYDLLDEVFDLQVFAGLVRKLYYPIYYDRLFAYDKTVRNDEVVFHSSIEIIKS